VALPLVCTEPMNDGSKSPSVYESNIELFVLLGKPVGCAEPVNDDEPNFLLATESRVDPPVLRSTEVKLVGKDECPVVVPL